MAEQITLHKKGGGATLTGPDGTVYTWAAPGQGVEVPHDFAVELLRIPDGDFYVQGDPIAGHAYTGGNAGVQTAEAAGLAGSAEGEGAPSVDPAVAGDAGQPAAEDDPAEGEPGPGEDPDGSSVTEPAPPAAAAVTEPAPPAKAPTTGRRTGTAKK